MKFAASVKKVIAFLLCLALLTSDVTVTNATSVDTTDVFAEISTEMLNETKNAGQESTGQEGNVSDPDGTGNTEKVRNTENSESTKVISNTENTETTEAIKNAEVTGNTESTEATEAIENTEATGNIENTETTEAIENTEATGNTENTEATEAIDGTEVTGNTESVEAFDTDQFSKYVIVNHGDNNVTVTIEHYDNHKYQAQDEQSAKIYSDDVCTMAPGAKISDYNKALNWDVDHVQVNGEAFSKSELENIEIHEDSVVKVFYQAKNMDYIGEASFYDYEVIPYDKAGQQRADLSINADSNYPSEQKDNRFTVGTVSQNLSENQYDTVTKKNRSKRNHRRPAYQRVYRRNWRKCKKNRNRYRVK